MTAAASERTVSSPHQPQGLLLCCVRRRTQGHDWDQTDHGGTQGEMCWDFNLIHLPRKSPSGQRDFSMQNKTARAIFWASSSYKATNTKFIKWSLTYHKHTEPVFSCTGKKYFSLLFILIKPLSFSALGLWLLNFSFVFKSPQQKNLQRNNLLYLKGFITAKSKGK